MPHLVFMGRYWKVSSDEFAIQSSCAAIGRLFWATMLCALLLISYPKLTKCPDGWIIMLYLCFSILSLSLSLICEGCLVYISLKGTMVDETPRRNLGFYLTIHLVLTLLQLYCAIFGIIIIDGHVIPCDSRFDGNIDVILLSIVVISQLVDIMGTLCCCALFSAQRVDQNLKASETATHSINIGLMNEVQRWEARCRSIMKTLHICTCNVFGGGSLEDLEAVAKMFTSFFHHDGFLDVVPSDVVAGLILVRLQQRAHAERYSMECSRVTAEEGEGEEKRMIINQHSDGGGGGGVRGATRRQEDIYLSLSGELLSPPSHHHKMLGRDGGEGSWVPGGLAAKNVSQSRGQTVRIAGRRVLDMTSVQDSTLLEDIAHYSLYGLAAYSVIMLMYFKPCSGLCGLCTHEMCLGSCKRNKKATVRDDNMCGMHQAAVRHLLRNYQAELVHASFSNDVRAKPYAIILDKQKMVVVLTIRGTLSLEDVITDIIAEPADLSQAGKRWGFQGEGRVAHAGMLQAAQWIRRDLDDNQVLHQLLYPKPVSASTPLHQLELVVVGHSLGAGAAVLLAMMLRNDFPRLKCFAYGAPGSVVDARTAEDCRSFVTSVCLGSDIICHLSVRTLSLAREQVLDAIGRAKVNKMVIMQAMFKEYISQIDDLMHRPGSEPDSDFVRAVREFTSLMREKTRDLTAVTLHIPGRVIHLAKTASEKKCLLSHPLYTATELSKDSFEEILLSPTMLWDHLPDRYYVECQRTWENAKNISLSSSK